MHRDPDNFPNPDDFKPERFLAENIAHNSYAYLPFGAGPRNCIGMRLAQMEVKVALKPLECHFTGGLIVPKQVELTIL
ncbi:unnamed protein product [Oppiella nova]|uniref:Cytochrome P450 n=1 Tax=Oppiella nova TaxID=334625 RepID=A0A7R9MCX4_9ACAR|nr:unnamed protein product [Oppiella nova]CAG2175057.1 unnamed protein product [Oppiella nova]